jgi:hypothetical protein
MNASTVDVFKQADLVDLLRDEPELLAIADAIAQTAPLRQQGQRRVSGRFVLLAASLALFACAATATALAVKQLTERPILRRAFASRR